MRACFTRFQRCPPSNMGIDRVSPTIEYDVQRKLRNGDPFDDEFQL